MTLYNLKTLESLNELFNASCKKLEGLGYHIEYVVSKYELTSSWTRLSNLPSYSDYTAFAEFAMVFDRMLKVKDFEGHTDVRSAIDDSYTDLYGMQLVREALR